VRSFFKFSGSDTPVAVEPTPTVFPNIDGADIAAVFAGNRVAGDFYDSVRVSPERVLIGLLDVAGRREANRKLLITAQETFRESGRELFSAVDINESDAMIELNVLINRRLIEASNGVHSCPAFTACYHEKLGTLCYCNAGHTSGLLRDSTGIVELGSTGLPLGLFSHATSDARMVGMERSAALLLVSQGLVSCEGGGRDNGGHEFGLEKVRKVLQNAPSLSAKELCSSVLSSVADYSGHVPLCDDRTALALIRTR
jgi:serine phosphatase RsbU (regulator of sigma subunit)